MIKNINGKIALSLCILMGALSAQENAHKNALTQEQAQEVERLIEQYISDHGEKILLSVDKYQKNEQAKQVSATNQYIKDNKQEIIFSKKAPTLGDVNNEISVIEYMDYRCGYCKVMSPVIQKLIEKNAARVVIKPVSVLGELSQYAATMALSAQQAKDFYSFSKEVNAIKASGEQYKSAVDAIAKKYNITKKDTSATVQSFKDELGDMRIGGTPTFILYNKRTNAVEVLQGAVPEKEFFQIIEQMKEKSS